MKPGEKGWLKEYLDYRLELRKNLSPNGKRFSHPEHSLYRAIQPTGLMYGQTGAINHPDSTTWNEQDRMMVLLAESLISSSLLHYDKNIKSAEELDAVVIKTIEHIGNFYNTVFPELAISSKTLFGRQKTPMELAERILVKRIEQTAEFRGNFWSSFFHNSLLFLDIFIFGQWIHTNTDRVVAEFFKYEREELRFAVVKVIALAAHSNNHIAPEERMLLEYFLQSTGLNSEHRKEAVRIFEKGVLMEEINLPTNNSWILKKYFLEMAILTLWADRRVEGEEEEFLKRFCRQLEFHDDDLENSMIAMEGFVLEHWKQLEILQNKQDYQQVSDKFTARLSRLTEKNKQRLLREVKANEELMGLLNRAKSGVLPEGDQARMRHLMFNTLQTMPAFAIISLPAHFLSLPVIMKILPPDFFAEALSTAPN